MTIEPGTYILPSSGELFHSDLQQFVWLYTRRPSWFVYLSPDMLTPEQARSQFPELFI